ncbi:hypothetical protein E2C01_081982 [Portunus trituberculatus]|uniref:Uncharacterized protein n=1 Tax=Portunus trituberculatus TaxID=210409 RepID=A0A5B7INS5_PORTR|nr:hypothetical protein [Portunus trituberculatus]
MDNHRARCSVFEYECVARLPSREVVQASTEASCSRGEGVSEAEAMGEEGGERTPTERAVFCVCKRNRSGVRVIGPVRQVLPAIHVRDHCEKRRARVSDSVRVTCESTNRYY